MSDKNSSTNSGIGVLGLLGIVFVALKLAGIGEVATWSWWWVTAPFWGGLAVFFVIVGLVLLFSFIIALLN